MKKFLIIQLFCFSVGLAVSAMICQYFFNQTYLFTTGIALLSGSILDYYRRFVKKSQSTPS